MAGITLIHYSAPPTIGGVETVLAHHARLMAAAGHTVKVMAGRGESFDERVRLVTFPLLDSMDSEILAAKADLDEGRVPPQFEALSNRILAFLKKEIHGGILIAHNVCSLHKNLALTAALKDLAGKRGAPRLILWHHDLAWANARYDGELHPGYPWDLLRQPWPEAVQVAVSDQRQEELAELMGIDREMITVVPNGIETAQFLKLEEDTQTYVRQFNLLAALPLLLLPVRITARKNIELGLRTLAELRKEFPDAQLLVTGPLGPHNPANAAYFERLLALREELGLREAARFLAEATSEYVPDDVVSDLYALADALLLPSREEGFGIPILEAGLARLPVFCSDIPSLRKLGGPHATYFDPDATAREVATLISDRLHSSQVFGLHATVKRAYTWDRVYSEKIAPLLTEPSP
jgi:glycosyltransferase involved in cell wall biosynthesis